jgi:hypothetical protein
MNSLERSLEIMDLFLEPGGTPTSAPPISRSVAPCGPSSAP